MPFLSDDWAQVDAVGAGPVARTPFNDFRPLYMATLWLDRRIGGLSPSLFHVTNLLWIAATAALVVVLARRYTGDARLALASGLVFSLHPFHVENAAWIGARSDAVFAVPFLLAAICYDRWRERASGLPLLALISFEAALLAKETAVTLPLLLLVMGLADPGRRPGRREWSRGYATLVLTAVVHFLVLRPWVLGGFGRTLTEGLGSGWIKNGLGLAAAAILPVDAEILVARPAVYGALTLLTVILLLVLAQLGSSRISRHALGAAAAFAILILPYLVGFQERYLFFPTAASSLFLASLIRAARGRLAVLLYSMLAAGWSFGCVQQWTGWMDAARASRRLVSDLVRESLENGNREMVIANMPFRVHGGSVAGDLSAALRLSGGRPLTVRAMTYVSYPTADADFLDGPPSVAIRLPPPDAVVRLRVREGPFSRLVWPRPSRDPVQVRTEGTTTLRGGGRVEIRIIPAAGGDRAAYAWVGGRLVRLFGHDGIVRPPPGAAHRRGPDVREPWAVRRSSGFVRSIARPESADRVAQVLGPRTQGLEHVLEPLRGG
jgi:hypothetical protein